LDGERRERDEADAAERAAGIAALRDEAAETLGRLRRDRAVQSTWDAIGRGEDERDRQVAAAQDARERSAEILRLSGIWSDHVGTLNRSLATSTIPFQAYPTGLDRRDGHFGRFPVPGA
jgi:hypothetical protein